MSFSRRCGTKLLYRAGRGKMKGDTSILSVSVTPHVTETLIKFLKMQLGSNARLNQDTKVWNQIQRQRFKVLSSV
jgi:hypothetical protein